MRSGSTRTACSRSGLPPADVTLAMQGQNIQVASGVLNQPPIENPGAFQIAVKTLGRLAQPEEFGSIVVKQTPSAVVRLRDVAKIELAALDYSSNSYLNVEPAVALAVFQRPGSNALSTAQTIRSTVEQLSKRFPPGLQHTIIYDPTQFIAQSVEEVEKAIGEAILLVVLVVVLFLQTWRAAIIPLVAIPISLIGTFFFMAIFGFTLNNLTLFGLVLAVGIVVDDAIVVVENVERNIAAGLLPREAAIKSMDEVGAALVAIALVLCAVFIPSGFISGISGQFYRQFALTIAGATIISLVVSLTLSPALCALLLRPHHQEQPVAWQRPALLLFRGLNFGFERSAAGYAWLAGRVVRFPVLMLVAYAEILAFGLNELRKTPTGFIPAVGDRSATVRSPGDLRNLAQRNERRRAGWGGARSTRRASRWRGATMTGSVAEIGRVLARLGREPHVHVARDAGRIDPRAGVDAGERIAQRRRELARLTPSVPARPRFTCTLSSGFCPRVERPTSTAPGVDAHESAICSAS